MDCVPWVICFFRMRGKADPPSTVGGLKGIDTRVGSWGKKSKSKKRKREREKETKIESVDERAMSQKENPTHFKEVDGERFVEKIA